MMGENQKSEGRSQIIYFGKLLEVVGEGAERR